MDHLTKPQRSEAMKKVGTRNTPAERLVKTVIRSLGYRFRTNLASLAGKPDVVIQGQRKAIFVHGCFWHFHACKRLPKSNRAFWLSKFESNKARDRRVVRDLKKSGWKVLVVWECWKKRPDYLKKRIAAFLSDH
jgi:DNA mismatch endonuclease (patch repair protein)